MAFSLSFISVRISLGFILILTNVQGIFGQEALLNATKHEGIIEEVGEVDTWTIDCTVEGTLYIFVTEVSGDEFDPRVELYASDGTTLLRSHSGADSAQVSYVISPGSYLVKILDNPETQGGTGSYEAQAAIPSQSYTVDDEDEGGALGNSIDLSGSLERGDVDLFSFEVHSGESVILKLTQVSGNADFTPKFSVFTPSGERYFFWGGTSLTYLAQVGGVFTVMVYQGDFRLRGIGDYRLQFVRPSKLYGQVSGGIDRVIQGGQTYEGSIDQVDEIDFFFVDASHRESIICNLLDTEANEFHPQVQVFRPDGSPATYGAGEDFAQAQTTATHAGHYVVVVTDKDRGTGNYKLILSHPPGIPIAPSQDELGGIPNGGYIDGDIEVGEMDFYTLNVIAGERIRLQLVKLSDNNFVAGITLYDPEGKHVAGAIVHPSNEDGTAATLELDPKIGGRFTVGISDSIPNNSSGPGTGTYRLHLALLAQNYTTAQDDEGGLLTNGNHYDGTIELADMDQYHFEAVSGDEVYLGVTPTGEGSLDPGVQVFDPFGRIKAPTSSNGFYRIESSGTYRVLISDSKSIFISGSYRLYYSKSTGAYSVPAGDEGGMLSNGSTAIGTIGEGDSDLYSFSAEAGESLELALNDHDEDGLPPFLVFYGPRGQDISVRYDSRERTYSATLNFSGIYRILVGKPSWRSDGGTYQFALSLLSQPSPDPSGTAQGEIRNGEQLFGTMTAFQERHLWTFEAEVDQLVWLTLSAQVRDASSGEPTTRVFSPLGSLVFQDTNSNLARFVAPESGTYTVELYNQSSSSNYGIAYLSPKSDFIIPEASGGGLLEPGVKSSGSLNIGGFDVWEFTAEVGDQVFLKMGDPTGGGLNPRLEILQPDGFFATSDASGYNSSACEFIVTQSGRHLVLASSYDDGDSGDYDLFLSIIANRFESTVDEEGGILESGVDYTAEITHGDMDLWSFGASEGDKIHLGAANGDSSGQSVRMEVFDPDGKRLVFWHWDSPARAAFTAGKSGSYVVKIDCGQNRKTALYHISFVNVASTLDTPEEGRENELINGKTHRDLLTAGDSDVWTFSAGKDEWIWLQSSFYAGSMTVYDPSGNMTYYGLGGGFDVNNYEFIAQRSGIYTVVISSDPYSTDLHEYQLHLARMGVPYSTSPGDEGGGLESGDSVKGAINDGDMDIWSFHSLDGDMIAIDLVVTDGSLLFYPEISVYSPEGTKLVSASRLPLTIRSGSTGVYTVLVNSADSGGVRPYQIGMSGMTTAPSSLKLDSSFQDGLKLVWPSPSNGWILEESSTMHPGSWSTSTQVPVDDGYEKFVEIVSQPDEQRFYRIIRP